MTSDSKRSEATIAPNPHLSGYLHRENQKRRGNCYVTCEALYHLLGGKAAHYTPHTLRHEGDVHWYLVHRIYRESRNLASRLLDTVTRENVLGDKSEEPLKDKYRYAAKHLFGDEGSCEIDDDAEVSYTTPTRAGAYVQVWMFVSEEDMEGEQPMDLAKHLDSLKKEGK